MSESASILEATTGESLILNEPLCELLTLMEQHLPEETLDQAGDLLVQGCSEFFRTQAGDPEAYRFIPVEIEGEQTCALECLPTQLPGARLEPRPQLLGDITLHTLLLAVDGLEDEERRERASAVLKRMQTTFRTAADETGALQEQICEAGDWLSELARGACTCEEDEEDC